jgi:hypothetical protein
MNIQQTTHSLSSLLFPLTPNKAPLAPAQTPARAAPPAQKGPPSQVADTFEQKVRSLKTPGFRQEEGTPGAYYRKVESGSDPRNKSISATVTLPRFQMDPKRMFESNNLALHGPLDKPSVYLGSHAVTKIGKVKVEAEADIGLQYTRRFDKNGDPTFVSHEVQNSGKPPTKAQLWSLGKDNVLRNQKDEVFKGDAKGLVAHFAFTPFARVDEPKLDPKGQPMFKAPGKLDKENKYLPLDQRSDQNRYFYAGEKVHMSVDRIPGQAKNNVILSVQRDGQPAQRYPFTSKFLGREEAAISLKRVSSIDQFTVQMVKGEKKRVGVESTVDKQVEATRASLTGMVWDRVEVKERDGKSHAMTGKDFKLMYGRDAKRQPVDEKATFHVSGFTSAGGERLDITPTLGGKR